MSYVRVSSTIYARAALAVLLLVMMVLGLGSQLESVLATEELKVEYYDPEGDSRGPGDYVYNTAFHNIYRPEYFDLRKFSVRLRGDFLELVLSFINVSNPLRSPLGFSPQVVHVYIVGKCESRRIDTLGLNVRLRAVDAWCVSIIIAPNLGGYVSRVVYVDGRTQAIDRVYAKNNTIVAEIPAGVLAGVIEKNISAWRYFVAVSAYDSHSEDGLVRISAKENAPIIFNRTEAGGLEFLPRVLDVLAKTVEDQFSMLNTYSAVHGDIAAVAAYPYAENTVLPYKPLIETATTTRVVTETYVKAYYLPGVTTTIVEYVQVPKYGVELYSLALVSVVLVVILAAILSKKERLFSKLS